MIIFGHPLDEVEAEENFHDPHDTHEVENKQHVRRKKVSSGSQMNIKGENRWWARNLYEVWGQIRGVHKRRTQSKTQLHNQNMKFGGHN